VDDKPRRCKKVTKENETCFLNHPVAETSQVNEVADPLRISRSCSVGFLDDVDTGMVACQLSLILLKRDQPKRLFLERKRSHRKPKPSHSFDSSDILAMRKSDDDRCDKVSLLVYLFGDPTVLKEVGTYSFQDWCREVYWPSTPRAGENFFFLYYISSLLKCGT